MKKENLNVNLQLLLFPGIGILGLLICLLMKEVYIMPVFYATETIQDNKIKEILSSVKKEVSHQADRIIKQS